MIDPNRVRGLLLGALQDDAPLIEGVVGSFRLSLAKLEPSRDEIIAMLKQLPEPFFDDAGGGWSFLNFCQTADGDLWTGEHRTCEALIALAMALGLAAFMLPRDLWEDLPGGMPYVVIKRSAFAPEVAHG